MHCFRASAWMVVFAVLSLPALSCHKAQPPDSGSSAAQPAQVDYANGGTISGTVHLTGNPPNRVKIDMAQDPACELSATAANVAEQYLANDGKFGNVYVFIKSGLGDQKYAAPATAVVLDQKGCRYVPHVVALMVGQPLEVRNSDMTMHNVHPIPSAPDNHTQDITQAPGSKPMITTFVQPELMMPVRCNNHPWMEALVNVAANPFYAISDANGNYQIRGLPPGTYTVAAVHERLGEKDTTVTVQAHGTATADFTYAARF